MARKSKQNHAPSAGSNVDLNELERLLEFMQKHGLEQFEYEHEGVRIVLKKAATPAAPVAAAPQPGYAPAVAPDVAPAQSVAPAGAPQALGMEPAKTAEDVHLVKSPIVGTFYSAPSPDAEPFVTVGARVEAGKVLCIIEAMKLMNEIESDVAGEIVRIFPENGSPVEYGESLFGIRPDRKK
jgi:acetyl-CoA carboxylase biotin carboxyl carrier protein